MDWQCLRYGLISKIPEIGGTTYCHLQPYVCIKVMKYMDEQELMVGNHLGGVPRIKSPGKPVGQPLANLQPCFL